MIRLFYAANVAKPMKNQDYRPDIDGLRAFAVLAVILFHLDFKSFSGGFVGVDVFFVISGFLITRIIRTEVLSKNSFSFSNFYLRRARRILPALFFTLILSFVLGYVYFAPQHFERLGGSLVHAVLSISNFYFWGESDYFDTASEFKPLLHTWSLGIEEQFYLFWPLFLVLILTRLPKTVPSIIIVIVGICSLFLNFIFADGPTSSIVQWFPEISKLLPDGSSTIFFLTPFRVFEFSIGAALVWIIEYQPQNKIILEPLVLLGLLMLGYPVLTYTEHIVFPSYNALLPCMGTALLIYCGTARYSGRLLSNSLAVKIGLISYSLYLVHWPLIVFYKYWKLDGFNLRDKLYVLGASILSAMLMYRFVEQPFRGKSSVISKSNRAFVILCVMVAAVVLIPAVNVWQHNGWNWRFNEKLAIQLDFEPHHYENYVWDRLLSHQKTFAHNGKPKVMVIGDSMAGDFVNVLGESGNLEKIDLVTKVIGHDCKSVFPLTPEVYEQFLPGKCEKQHEAVINSPLLDQADSVILASLWGRWDIKLLDSTVKFLKKRGVKQVAVVGRKDQSVNGIKFNAKFAYRKSADRLRTPIARVAKNRNAEIAELKENVTYIDVLSYFCDPEGCQRVTEDGYLIIYDKSHLSPRGARYIGVQATDSTWMKSLLHKI